MQFVSPSLHSVCKKPSKNRHWRPSTLAKGSSILSKLTPQTFSFKRSERKKSFDAQFWAEEARFILMIPKWAECSSRPDSCESAHCQNPLWLSVHEIVCRLDKWKPPKAEAYILWISHARQLINNSTISQKVSIRTDGCFWRIWNEQDTRELSSTRFERQYYYFETCS
jgi:hypothetical protein